MRRAGPVASGESCRAAAAAAAGKLPAHQHEDDMKEVLDGKEQDARVRVAGAQNLAQGRKIIATSQGKPGPPPLHAPVSGSS